MIGIMKKVFVVALFAIGMGPSLRGQFVVSDPTSYEYLIQSIHTSTETLNATQEELKVAKDAVEKLEKVNSRLSQGKLVLRISDNISDMIKDLNEMPKYLAQIEDKDVKRAIKNLVESRIEQVDLMNTLIKDAITSSALTGGDFERLEFLMDMYDRTSSLRADIRSVKKDVVMGSMY